MPQQRIEYLHVRKPQSAHCAICDERVFEDDRVQLPGCYVAEIEALRRDRAELVTRLCAVLDVEANKTTRDFSRLWQRFSDMLEPYKGMIQNPFAEKKPDSDGLPS